MGWFTGIIVYLMIFWTVLFAVLPWGNRPHDQEGLGTAGSAPADPRIKQKFLITAIVSIVIWGIVFLLVQVGIIDFYAIADRMIEEDHMR